MAKDQKYRISSVQRKPGQKSYVLIMDKDGVACGKVIKETYYWEGISGIVRGKKFKYKLDIVLFLRDFEK